jgi:hypothetical protein
MTKTKRHRNSLQRDKGTDSILGLQEHGYKLTRLSPFQWRVNDRLDLFPTNRKYHDTFNNERGDWQGALDICRRILK